MGLEKGVGVSGAAFCKVWGIGCSLFFKKIDIDKTTVVIYK